MIITKSLLGCGSTRVAAAASLLPRTHCLKYIHLHVMLYIHIIYQHVYICCHIQMAASSLWPTLALRCFCAFIHNSSRERRPLDAPHLAITRPTEHSPYASNNSYRKRKIAHAIFHTNTPSLYSQPRAPNINSLVSRPQQKQQPPPLMLLLLQRGMPYALEC